jgi:glycosyltransferase involved in cell wall biosynthesis
VVAGLWENTGGPAEVIPNLCRAQSAAGASVTLCLVDGNNAGKVMELVDSDVEVKLFPALDNLLRFSPKMARYLISQKNVDIIHNHGHWLWPNWIAAYASFRLKVSLITTPHGTLVPGMLRVSKLKKMLAWMIFDKKIIHQASVIHALSEAEKDGMRRKLGKNIKKVKVVPNGVNIPEPNLNRYSNQKRTLLFLSRVAPIKGVVELLNAWINTCEKFPNWKLKVVGPIDDTIKDVVEYLAKKSASIELCGPVYDSNRWDVYSEASAFILPTFGEGLPTVLLEAAAHRLPIITTHESNFKELIDKKGCIVTRPEEKEIEMSLLVLMNLESSELEKIGNRAYCLIKENYLWEIVALKWLSIYEKTRLI